MAARVVESKYIPREHSIAFHARAQRFAALVYHRRAGKTVACINDIIDKAAQNPRHAPRYGYIAPLYKQAKEIAWGYLKYYAEPLIEKTMESELSVTLKGGQLIRLYGADNPDALRGVYFDGVILDEYGDMQPRLFGEVIAPTLVDRKGWCVFIGTPKGPNHFKELWDKGIGNPKWFTRMLKASESGIIDAEELELMLTLPGSDEESYQQEYECDFHAAVRGAYYGKLINQIETTNFGFYPWNPKKPVLTGWDIGYSDDTSIWFVQINGDEIAVIDFFTASGLSADEVLDKLLQKPYEYAPGYLPHDAKNKSFQTGKSTREIFMARQFKSQLVAKLSIQDGIQAVRKTLPKCFFNTTSPEVREGINALRIYQREWDAKARRFKDAPKHDWSSNPADAFRTLACGINPSAAKRWGAATTGDRKPPSTSNVITLDALFADRDARRIGGRV